MKPTRVNYTVEPLLFNNLQSLALATCFVGSIQVSAALTAAQESTTAAHLRPPSRRRVLSYRLGRCRKCDLF